MFVSPCLCPSLRSWAQFALFKNVINGNEINGLKFPIYFSIFIGFCYIGGAKSCNVFYGMVKTAAKSLQSCPTLCNPIDGSPPGFPVPGILQARTLEWVAISFSNAWKLKVKVKSFSRIQPSATPWTAAYQAPLSTGFSRQEYWSGVPLPSPWWRLDFIKLTWDTIEEF